ncbi:hypothetical protein RUM43_013018 [Polyplax serrata]|uniref:Uncharacterized protein n=1 Tax=Polyplax serrata TaxID=468196 RepID=A0AAN8NJS7_POLSC
MGRSRVMETISIENHGVLDTTAKGKKRQKIPTDQPTLSFFNFEGEEVIKEVKVSPRRKNDSSVVWLSEIDTAPVVNGKFEASKNWKKLEWKHPNTAADGPVLNRKFPNVRSEIPFGGFP